MADWTDQSTDSLLPGEPWTSAKALAVFENPVALAEGATGAPRIATIAMTPPAAGSTTIARLRTDTQSLQGETSYQKIARGTVLVAGVVRLVVAESTSVDKDFRKNNVSQSVISTDGLQFVDMTVALGDEISVWAKAFNGTVDPATIGEVRAESNTLNMAVA